MNLIDRLFKGDRAIWFIIITLSLISFIEVYSATSTTVYRDGNYLGPIIRHASFLMVGLALILVIHNIPSRFLSVLIILLPASILLLVFTLVSEAGVEVNDAKRWMSLGNISFQPSELAKLSCVVFIAFLLSRKNKYSDVQIFWYILIGVSSVCILIFRENISTSLILFFTCFLMMFIGGFPMKWMGALSVVLVVLGISFLVYLFYIMPDDDANNTGRLATAKHRIENLFKKGPPLDAKTYVINNDNRQETFAKIAIANGGFGKFPGYGQQRDTLPLAFSDFIYAIIIEEMGFITGLIVLFLYLILLIRVGIIARKCEKLFPKFLVLGCGLMIGVQALSNMAVVVGLFPVTGQPLPLVSQGGTSIIVTCFYFGMILSVSRFGAGMGNEDDEDDDDIEEDRDSDLIEFETDISDKTPLTIVENLT
ncbi:MAG: FtsW/RodA/SpoVE family cell cycle protein [Tannerellaceae bacterium]|jgi:cell division protein FtsW|nr:FtsW/RodA/SpoVE family cell cycle protein [Tannerellaceae bacterium]